MTRTYVLACLTAVTASLCVAGCERSKPAVAQPLQSTCTLAPAAIQVHDAPDIVWELLGPARMGSAPMREAATRLAAGIAQLPSSARTPMMRLRLVSILTDLEDTACALEYARALVAVPATTSHDTTLYGYPSLSEVTREGRWLLARSLARNGNRAECLAQFDTAGNRGGYSALLRAEALAVLADTTGVIALLPGAVGAGNPDAPFSDALNRMRAVVLARALGNDSLARTIAAPIIARGYDAERWPQWHAAFSIVKQVLDNASAAPSFHATGLREGTYDGLCEGFNGTVNVKVTVGGGTIRAVKVTGTIRRVEITATTEDRPWSALETIPQRIERAHGLAVDAVTSATVTSCAIVAATDNALADAR